MSLHTRSLVLVSLVGLIGGCGGPPAEPQVTSFTAEREVITIGQKARLTAVFSGGGASISGVAGPVTSGEVVESEPLTADTTFTLTVTGEDGKKTATGTVTVRAVAPPVVTSFTAAAPLLVRGATASLTAVFTGGTGAITPDVGAVTSGVATVTPALTATQAFTLTVTNAAGDAARATTTVEVRDPPTITTFTAAKTTVTRGTGTTLSATYTGGDGVVSGTVGALASGAMGATGPLTQDTTFTLTVTGAVGTPATATVTVQVVDPPVIQSFVAGAQRLTEGGSTSLTATFTGGTGSIAPGVGAATSGAALTVSPTQTTTYTLTVTNAAMDSVTETATVDVVPAPVITSFTTPAADLTVGGAPSLLAFFSNGTATISGLSGAITSGVALTAPALAAPGSTTYTLTVTNSLGAMVSRALTVTAWPPASIANFAAAPTVVTTGGPTTLSASFVGTGTIDQGVGAVTSPLSRVTTVAATTTYTLTVRNPAGDTATSTVTVTAVPPPVISSFTAANANVSVGQQPSLTAVFSGGTASILGGAGNPTSGVPISANALTTPGTFTYTLVVTNAAGTSTTRALTVTAWEPATITSFSAAPTLITQGTNTVLSGSFSGGTGTLSVGGAVTSPFIRSLALPATTTITLTVSNPTGSNATASVTVTAVPAPVITSFTGRALPSGDAGVAVTVTVPIRTSVGFTGVFSNGAGRMTWPTGAANLTSGMEFSQGPLSNDALYSLSVTNDAGTVVTRNLAVEVDHAMYIAATAGNFIPGPGLVVVYPSHLKQAAAGPASRRIYVQGCDWPTGLAYEPAVGPVPPFLWVACRPANGLNPLIARIQNPHLVNNTASSRATSALTPISGANTLMTAPQSLVLAGNELFVLNQASATVRASIQVFSKSTGGNVAPLRAIIPPASGDVTQLGQTSQLFVYQNELYVTSNTMSGVGTQGVLVYPLSWTGTNIAPTRTLTSPQLSDVRGVYVDADGLFVGTTSGTYRFALGASGAAMPTATAGVSIQQQLTRFDDTLFSAFRFGLNRQPITLPGTAATVGTSLLDFDSPAATVIDPAY